ncbi:sulfatase [Paenibacillus thalictri]|uniref:Arylsulfatase n=1 Tax=Paenibacillus thalictri TaxID=2527873 RepID=A0A4Q9DSE3_9BACL|nr:sulfatase-like hydrolase/transferase [Paenibacillus thalictri]TBL78996.1 arylsulfatase [Paenibacillus thalictri]
MTDKGNQRKPNVVIIMADQLRFDVVGETYTPNIHRLQQESVVFDRAYCASPLCVPARGSFFSGTYPNVNGSLINPWEPLDAEFGKVRPGTANLYELMEKEWDSWHTGKQHFHMDGIRENTPHTHWHTLEGNYDAFLKEHGKRHPGGPAFKGAVPEMAFGQVTRRKRYSVPKTGCFEEGFDYFYDGYITRTTIDAIRARDRSKPLLVNAMFVAPHPPLDIPEPWYSMYRDAELPANVGVWAKSQSPLQMYNLPGVIGGRYSREDWQRIWPVYLGLVTLLDHCVGQIVAELKNEGLYDDTLLLFTSDHGEMLGSHCLYQKMCMYEESVRTPLMFKFPASSGIVPKRIEEPVSAVDVLPTLCDYLDVATGDHAFSGVSLMNVMEQEASPQRQRDLFIQYDGNGARSNFQRCIVRGEYKLIADLFKDELFLELYDVVGDPQEQINLAFDEAQRERVEAMLSALRRHMAGTHDMLSLPPDAYEQFKRMYEVFHQ